MIFCDIFRQMPPVTRQTADQKHLLTRPTKHQHHLIIIEIIAPDLSPEIVWKEYKPFHIYTFELLHRNYGKTQ